MDAAAFCARFRSVSFLCEHASTSAALAVCLAHPIAVTVISFLLMWAYRNLRPWSVPGPYEFPIIGAVHWLARYRDDVLSGMLALCVLFEFRTFTIKWFCERRFFVTTCPKNVEHVLKNRFENYPKGEQFNSTLRTLLGAGIFATDGEQWKSQRQLFSHAFSDAQFSTTILDALVAHGAKLHAILAAAADDADAPPLDMHSLFHRFTLDTIGLVAFGVPLHSLEDPAQPFVAAFDAAQAAIDLRFFTPGWRLFGACLRSEAVLQRSTVVLRDFCDGVIATRRAKGDWATRSDVLSRAMAAVDGKGAPLYLHDNAALRDIVLSFIIAGRDTTAQALSWAVLSIARSPPDVAARLAQEARRAGAGGPTWAPSYDAVARELKFAKAVTLETLRLYPSVPKEWKSVVADDTLPDGTFVPAGSILIYLPYAMGRSPGLWGDDAPAFRPERFVDAPMPSPFKFSAFNAGQRACLGQKMALAEAAYVLATVYGGFELELAPAEQAAPDGVPTLDSLTLPQKKGVTVRVKRRV